jgi:hypothetical protein
MLRAGAFLLLATALAGCGGSVTVIVVTAIPAPTGPVETCAAQHPGADASIVVTGPSATAVCRVLVNQKGYTPYPVDNARSYGLVCSIPGGGYQWEVHDGGGQYYGQQLCAYFRKTYNPPFQPPP